MAEQTAAVPGNLPSNLGMGVLTVIPSNRKWLSREMTIALAVQAPPTHMSHGFLCIKDGPIELSRELAAEKALEMNAKYLWFVDDDTVPPPNTMKKLIYVLDNFPEVAVCGGVYVTREADTPQPLVFRGMGRGSYWHWKVGDIFEVTGMGAGCMMIKTEVFKKLPKPWFTFEESVSDDPMIASHSISEDIHFCNLVQQAGYKIFAHGGVLCDHWDTEKDTVYRLPPDSYPMRPRETSLVAPVQEPQESQK
jgi:Glycosyl transferase family 2